MICDYCKKEYKKETQVVDIFGSKFCLHDEKLQYHRRVAGFGMRNDALSVKVAKSGRTRTEQKYIDKEKKAGNVVVRGSDGLLRSVGEE